MLLSCRKQKRTTVYKNKKSTYFFAYDFENNLTSTVFYLRPYFLFAYDTHNLAWVPRVFSSRSQAITFDFYKVHDRK